MSLLTISTNMKILGYILGYVRKILKNLSCALCADALICKDNLIVYYLTLNRLKDKGDLIYPSEVVVKVIKMCESVFEGSICGDYYLRPGMSH